MCWLHLLGQQSGWCRGSKKPPFVKIRSGPKKTSTVGGKEVIHTDQRLALKAFNLCKPLDFIGNNAEEGIGQ